MDDQNGNTDTKPIDKETILKNSWAIRPCHLYKDEYDDCSSFKARFHQYFIYGENSDCTQWLTDYRNCKRLEDSNGNNLEAGAAIIKSEEERRLSRLRPHYANDTWQKRTQPPEDWAKPLPEWLEQRNENTYLQIKQNELLGLASPQEEKRSMCAIM